MTLRGHIKLADTPVSDHQKIQQRSRILPDTSEVKEHSDESSRSPSLLPLGWKDDFPKPFPAPTSETSKLARLSMILAFSSVVGGLIITSLPAVILGHVAKGQIRSSGGRLRGEHMADMGIAIGYTVSVISVFVSMAILWSFSVTR